MGTDHDGGGWKLKLRESGMASLSVKLRLLCHRMMSRLLELECCDGEYDCGCNCAIFVAVSMVRLCGCYFGWFLRALLLA